MTQPLDVSLNSVFALTQQCVGGSKGNESQGTVSGVLKTPPPATSLLLCKMHELALRGARRNVSTCLTPQCLPTTARNPLIVGSAGVQEPHSMTAKCLKHHGMVTCTTCPQL